MKNIRIIMMAAALFGLCACQTDKQPATPEEVCNRLGFCWNLGNHFDSYPFAADATPDNAGYWDGAVSSEQLYKNLAAAGVKTVRIPVTWGAWEGEAPDYTLDSAFVETIRTNLHWAKDAGLNVILNTHHDEYWLDIYNAAQNDSVNAAIEQRIVRTWEQVATAFKDEGSYLYFETFNEIHAKTDSMEDWSSEWCRRTPRATAVVNEWIALAVNAIRATGGKNADRWIGIAAYMASPDLAMTDLQFPADPAHRLMVSVHTYSPCDFTLEDKTEVWGEGDNEAAAVQEFTSLFSALKERFVDQGIPVYLSEYGCDSHATEEGTTNRLRYLETVTREARKAGVTPVIWDNGFEGVGAEHHYYFNHTDGTFPTEEAKTIIESLTAICK